MLPKEDNQELTLRPDALEDAAIQTPLCAAPAREAEQEAETRNAFEHLLASKQYGRLNLSPEARKRLREARQNPVPPTEALKADCEAYRAFAAQNPDSNW